MERKNDRLPIFTERFRELQGEQSNTEFAEFLGISRQTVGFYWNGDRVPDAITIIKIAKKCEVSADWLLGLDDFPTVQQKKEANDLFDHLMELMEMEFNEHDRRRVKRILFEVIHGFKSAMTHYLAYSWYEDAMGHTALALSTVAQCLEFAQSQENKAPYDRKAGSDLLIEIDRIINGAATSAYVDLGHFFKACRNEIMEVLNAGDCYEMDLGYTDLFDKLKDKTKK